MGIVISITRPSFLQHYFVPYKNSKRRQDDRIDSECVSNFVAGCPLCTAILSVRSGPCREHTSYLLPVVSLIGCCEQLHTYGTPQEQLSQPPVSNGCQGMAGANWLLSAPLYVHANTEL